MRLQSLFSLLFCLISLHLGAQTAPIITNSNGYVDVLPKFEMRITKDTNFKFDMKNFEIELKWQCIPISFTDPNAYDPCKGALNQVDPSSLAKVSEDGNIRLVSIRRFQQLPLDPNFRYRIEIHIYRKVDTDLPQDRQLTLGRFFFVGSKLEDFQSQNIVPALSNLKLFSLPHFPQFKVVLESGGKLKKWVKSGIVFPSTTVQTELEFGEGSFTWRKKQLFPLSEIASLNQLPLTLPVLIYPEGLSANFPTYKVNTFIDNQLPFRIASTKFAQVQATAGLDSKQQVILRINDCLYDSIGKSISCPTRPQCKQIGLKSFIAYGKTTSLSNLVQPDVDYCRPSVEENVFQQALPLLKAIGDNHQQVAKSFQIPVTKLFPGDLKLLIVTSLEGPLSSWYGRLNGELVLGVFPYDQVKDLDLGIYTHELGHYLSVSPQAGLPKPLKLLFENSLFMETASDLLAMVINGKVITQAPDIRCEVRRVTRHQGYSYSRGYFDLYYSTRRNLNCCRKLEANPDRESSPYWKYNCKQILEHKNEILEKIGQLDRTPLLESGFFDSKLTPIDPHQIGLPISSFFAQLNEELPELTPQSILSKSLDIPLKSVEKPVACQVQLPSGKVKQFSVTLGDPRGFFTYLRGKLALEQLQTWDQLWQKKQLDLGMKYGDAAIKQHALEKLQLDVMSNSEISKECSDYKPNESETSSSLKEKPICELVCN